MLSELGGRTHEVVSGVWIGNHQRADSFSDSTSVSFNPLSAAEILHYTEHYEVLDKAGAYAIQEGIGLTSVSSIRGSYYNVMGLPIHRVYESLATWKVFPGH
jgi:septum formation protein